VLHVIVRGIFHLDHFYIYNRWGEVVFQTNDANIGWNGDYKNDPQPVGVYVYFVDGTDAKGNRISKQGNVTLLK
jgi:gliding motility-associated-like protein